MKTLNRQNLTSSLCVLLISLLLVVTNSPVKAQAQDKVQISLHVQASETYGQQYSSDVGRSFRGWTIEAQDVSGGNAAFDYSGNSFTSLTFSDPNVLTIYLNPGSYSFRVTCPDCETKTSQLFAYTNSSTQYDTYITVNHVVQMAGTMLDNSASPPSVMPYLNVLVYQGNNLVAQGIADDSGKYSIGGLKTGVGYTVYLKCYVYGSLCKNSPPTYTFNNVYLWGQVKDMQWVGPFAKNLSVNRSIYDNYTPHPLLSISPSNPTVGSNVLCYSPWETKGDYVFVIDSQVVSVGSQNYTINQQDAGKNILCSVTEKLPFVGDVLFSSQSTSVAVIDSYISASIGSAKVGVPVVATPSSYDKAIRFQNYRWYVDGVLTNNENADSYTPSPDSVGKYLSYKVEAIKEGYATKTVTSNSSLVIQGEISKQPKPVLSGVSKMGSTLTVEPGVWDQGVLLSYQWLRDGVAIAGEDRQSHLLDASDAGHQISVDVYGDKNGYSSAIQRSNATEVAFGSILMAPIPDVSGQAKVWSTFTAVTGLWDSGVSLTYQWLRDGTPINGATSSTYYLDSMDLGHGISVAVTGYLYGYSTITRTSIPRYLLTEDPHYSVNISASSFAMRPGTVITSAFLKQPYTGLDGPNTYQWLRDGSPISGATSSAYVITSADQGHLISLISSATASYEIYQCNWTGACFYLNRGRIETTSSNSIFSPLPDLQEKPTTVIAGFPIVGKFITAISINWNKDITLSYQWLRDGVEIPAATDKFYLVSNYDSGTILSVKVTGELPGFQAQSDTAITDQIVTGGSFDKTPKPTLTGEFVRGSQIVAEIGAWDQDVSLSFAWLRDGENISGANGTSYLITASDLGKEISLQVTGIKDGYITTSVVSDSFLALNRLSQTPAPIITGTPSVGERVTALLGTWDEGVEVSYQWLLNGSPIFQETDSSYVVRREDAGRILSLSVTGRKNGYSPVTVFSNNSSLITGGIINISPTPTILGKPVVGGMLSAVVGFWDPAVDFTYEWQVGGRVVSNEVSYRVTNSDAGKVINLNVIGSKPGYASISKSASIAEIVTGGKFLNYPSPLIVGVPASGEVLTADVGSWDADVSFQFQWKSNGVVLQGESSPELVLSDANLGNYISVTVTATKLGFDPQSIESALTPQIRKKFLNYPKPVILGTANVGQTLVLDIGTWDSGTTKIINWYRDGILIAGASSENYLLTNLDSGSVIQATVTGSKPGYMSYSVSSANTSVVRGGTLQLTPIPVITGTLLIDQALSVDAGKWDTGVVLSFQWLKSGLEIPNATDSTYTTSLEDWGASISVRVTGTREGSPSVSKVGYVARLIGARTLMSTPKPLILGISLNKQTFAGSKLTVVPGFWDKGTSLVYQWLRDGVPITWATSSAYTTLDEDAGHNISVRVTGSMATYLPSSQTSMATDIVLPALSSTPVPSVSGVVKVASTLAVVPGVWDQGVSLTYQWLRDGAAISNATNSTYVLIAADAGRQISVQVTGSMVGYVSATKASIASTVLNGSLSSTPVPSVSGVVKVASTLAVVPGVWDQGVSLTYQWLRDGAAISNATNSTYVLIAADAGRQISVQVTGSMVGYVSATKASGSRLTPFQVMKVTVPTLLGSAKVGQNLKVQAMPWVPGALIRYQWLVDGNQLKGATGSSLKLTSTLKGRKVSVEVQQSSFGFQSSSSKSASLKIG
jgi:hypothetical protein